MNIKIRLSLQFSLIVTAILLFFALLVLYFSFSRQHAKFRQNILDSAKNYATLFINVAEVDSVLLNKIQESSFLWDREELAITDTAYNILYSNNIEYLSDSLTLVRNAYRNSHYFTVLDKEGVFYRHIFENRTYYVFTLAFDKTRAAYLDELRKILFWSILSSIALSILLSYLFARRAIRPISRIINSVKEINSLRLSSRLDEGDRRDEIDQLSVTFNQMLSDLEIAFRNQEDFVSNASHELRTPLTVMISETDYFISRERSREEYTEHISELLRDLKKINSLLNSLLELAQVNKNTSISFTPVRIDEIVFDAIHQIKNKYQDQKIIPKIQYPENEKDLIINGNEGLLIIAFKNLIDNACKFSNENVIVEFRLEGENITVVVADRGIGIPEKELDNIYKPFTRGSNVKFIGGFGIGLTMVSGIMQLHRAEIKVESMENKGTRINMLFKRLNPQS
ncbi:MAG TPA: ATP-binding protein [Bacteroidales bacterium]|nr:ATP-binding protein [Bacteroidales bacterium]